MNYIESRNNTWNTPKTRIDQRRSELVSQGSNALLIMLEKGIFTSVTSIRITNELGSSKPFLISVTGETSGLNDESVFNERFSQLSEVSEFVDELSQVMFPNNNDRRLYMVNEVQHWGASIGSSIRIYPI